MAELFADVPELLVNSVEIAKRCSLEIKLGASMLPAYPVPSGASTESFLREEAERGFAERLEQAKTLRGVVRDAQAYAARLDLELGVICAMGFAGYFLIVADFIRWARENGVPVGPGRGSGAGSLGGVRPRHHRPRSDRARPAVRAIPESGTRVDAGLRRRFLHGGPRPGHRIRRQQIRPRPRVADHHLRDARGEGGGARRRARARPQLFVRRQDREAHSFRNRHDARQGARAGGGAAAPVRGRFRRPRIDRSCAHPRRPGAKRRYARGRRRHRALGAHRFHAAVLRRGQHHARHPIRQGRRRGCRPGQVRFSRPAYAHRHRLGGARHQCRARPRERTAAGDECAADGRCRRPISC